jgi:hypothetical protein
MYYTDINNSENVKYINRLPREYVPQIRIIIKETEKNLKNKKKILTQKYLREMYKKFDCKRTRKAVLGNHRKSGYFTRKNRNQKK